jgi:hypothetical protein
MAASYFSENPKSLNLHLFLQTPKPPLFEDTDSKWSAADGKSSRVNPTIGGFGTLPVPGAGRRGETI